MLAATAGSISHSSVLIGWINPKLFLVPEIQPEAPSRSENPPKPAGEEAHRTMLQMSPTGSEPLRNVTFPCLSLSRLLLLP